MSISYYGGMVVECLSADTKPESPDGWFLKELDSGLSYIRKAGVWHDINLGLSFVKATKSGSMVTGTDGTADITFNTGFIADDYNIGLSCSDPGGNNIVSAFVVQKTAAGFTVKAKRSPSGQGQSGVTVSWVATREYNP